MPGLLGFVEGAMRSPVLYRFGGEIRGGEGIQNGGNEKAPTVMAGAFTLQ